MIQYFTTLLVVADTSPWSLNTAIVMIVANLFSIAIGYYAIQKKGQGPKLPMELPAMFTGFGVPELLATLSFGHILGTGLILGLSNAGVI